MPRMACRVVWGRLEVMATFWPISALVSVDLPALGRPTKHANPDQKTMPPVSRTGAPGRPGHRVAVQDRWWRRHAPDCPLLPATADHCREVTRSVVAAARSGLAACARHS